jgi:DNA ligase-1
MQGMRFADVVATSEAVARTRSRSAKVDTLAALLCRASVDDVEPVVAMLVGTPRQGRFGVGWATVAGVDVPAAEHPTLTVAGVDSALAAIADSRGTGSAAVRRKLLGEVLRHSTPAETDFLRRLLTGELRQGALAGIMIDAVARAARVPAVTVRRAVMRSGDLPHTARLALEGGAAALATVSLEVLRPVLPMLAASSDGVDAALGATGRASVEWKLDGARIQVHRSGDEVRVFTRNLNDVTHRVPEIVSTVRTFASRELVLDGEALGLADDEAPHRFQDTMSRFGREEAVAGDVALRAFFFDCLRVDGTDLLDEPLVTRVSALREAVPAECRVPSTLTDDAAVARAFLDDALRTGHEGVMVKALDSAYEAGRRGSAWRKVKPVHTLDLVVLAAEWGHGRRRGWLSNLHLGARDPDGIHGPNGGFVMVGKTFKGLTDDLLRWQTEALRALAEREEGHVVFVRPELVVEIALDGVQQSSRYPGGVALRFARVRGYRPDKAPEDADNIGTVRALLPHSARG